MFLSVLHINAGNNPDRPRPGTSWLRNVYRVHQRLCMAFPSAARVAEDPDYLNPFDPDDFGTGNVHVERGANAGFLYRIDPRPGSGVMILVQSALEPNWEYAFHNAGYLLTSSPKVEGYEPSFHSGDLLRFRLVANPTRRLSKNSREADGTFVKAESVKKRVPVPVDQLEHWLVRRGGTSGFAIPSNSFTVQPGYVFMSKKANGRGQRVRTARYEGILVVTDSELLVESVASGIGPAKAFGCGLLTVIPTHKGDAT